MKDGLKKIMIYFSFIMLSGCASLPPITQPTVYYGRGKGRIMRLYMYPDRTFELYNQLLYFGSWETVDNRHFLLKYEGIKLEYISDDPIIMDSVQNLRFINKCRLKLDDLFIFGCEKRWR